MSMVRWMVLGGCLVVAGCGGDKPAGGAATSGASAKPMAATSAKPGASAAASAKATTGKKPEKKAQAKAKLDEKPKGEPKGTWIDVPGTTAAINVPEGWKSKTEGTYAKAAPDREETAGIIATTYEKGADPTATLGTLATALGLSECEWAPTEDVTLGAAEIPAKVADGVCLAGDKGMYVMYAMVEGSDINAFVLGGFDEEAKEGTVDEVVGSFLSIKPKAADDKKADEAKGDDDKKDEPAAAE